MLAVELRQFADFDRLRGAALEAAAHGARRLRVPAHRWVVRPGRRLSSRMYLLEGRVRLLNGARSLVVNAGSRRARLAVYPGAAGLETMTAAAFLSIDPALLEPAAEPAGRADVAEVGEPAPWERRFLTSPLLARLDPVVWQRLLRSMARHHLDAGDVVVAAGDEAACCYVLGAGRAEIRSPAGARLAVLEPGALFGEDALVSGGARNATVVMCTAGWVMSLETEQFRTWLLNAVVTPLQDAAGRPVILLDPRGSAATESGMCGPVRLAVGEVREAAARLSPVVDYAVVGGTWAERSLAAFLLAERGIRASPVGGCDGV